jgi:hypothetical protein
MFGICGLCELVSDWHFVCVEWAYVMKCMPEERTSCTGVQASSGDLSAEVKFVRPSLAGDALRTLMRKGTKEWKFSVVLFYVICQDKHIFM